MLPLFPNLPIFVFETGKNMRQSFFFITIMVIGIVHLRANDINSNSLVTIPGNGKAGDLQSREPSGHSSGDSLLHHQKSEKVLNMIRQFSPPCKGKVISPFGPRSGRMHSGTDVKMNRGDTVYAVYSGRVTRAGAYYGYGNQIVIRHGQGLETSYAHLLSFLVKKGEEVVRGAPVGLAGKTGRATTNHLHFEIREKRRPFDAERVFDFERGALKDELQGIKILAELLEKPGHSSSRTHPPQNYTVKKGDSLWKIARRHHTTVSELCRLNRLQENSVLQVGMVLQLH